MRDRLALIALAGAVACLVAVPSPRALAQAPITYAAAPPPQAALDRLNLRTEWTAFLPIDTRRDAVGPVQVIDENQIFAQTASGLLIAVDAKTGAKQWTFRYPAGFVNLYPVGVNERFVFAVNVARLFCFQRYTGVLEFDYELPGSVTSGPVADRELVYVTLNGTRLVGYRFPGLVVAQTPQPGRAVPNAAEAIAERYAPPGRGFAAPAAEEAALPRESLSRPTDPGLGPNQRTPSIPVLPSVVPPYTLSNRGLYATPSLTVLPTMRQPYTMRPDYMRYNQQTPSITALPPSVVRVQELANLSPRGVEPTSVWAYSGARRFAFEPVLTDLDPITAKDSLGRVSRVWLTTDSAVVEAIDKFTGTTQVVAPLQDRVMTAMAGPLALAPDQVFGFVGLLDGNVVSLDLLRGGERGPRVNWRASVGGVMNRKPVVARDAVFAAGEQSGVARIDVAGGDVAWRTEGPADRVLAVNDEHVYVYDRRGQLLIYDRRGGTGDARRVTPLARLDVPGFTVPVTNDQTDRVLIATPAGLLICLRDASAKYIAPAKLLPPPPAVPPRKEAVKEPMTPDAPPPPLEPKAPEPKAPEPKAKEPEPKK